MKKIQKLGGSKSLSGLKMVGYYDFILKDLKEYLKIDKFLVCLEEEDHIEYFMKKVQFDMAVNQAKIFT